MGGEGRIDGVDVGVVEAGAGYSGLEVIQPDHPGHTAEEAESALVQADEGEEVLGPDRLLASVFFGGVWTASLPISSGRF